MILLWVSLLLLSLGAGCLVLWRGAAAARSEDGDFRMAAHRRALADIDDLAGRGLLDEGEHRAARAEAGRRLLAAADAPRESPVRRAPGALVFAAAVSAPVLAMILYALIGRPGYADQPFRQRLAAWRLHPETATGPELAAALSAVAREHPDDPEPLRRLAELDLGLGDPDGAVHVLRRADRLAPGRIDILGPLGEILVLKSKGKIDPEAIAVLREVLRLDPTSAPARYYLARAKIENGEVSEGLAVWRSLLTTIPEGDPRHSALASEIAAVAATGALPPPEPAAPADLSQAIAGMVAGLAARLEAHPDDPQGWIRLVRAYAVLHDEPRKQAALVRAQRLFANDPAVIQQLSDAARASS